MAMAQQMMQQSGMQPPPLPGTAAAAPAAGPDRIAQLQQLAALKQSGLLTDAEFEAEKARILAGG
jgi:hypothetical protein